MYEVTRHGSVLLWFTCYCCHSDMKLGAAVIGAVLICPWCGTQHTVAEINNDPGSFFHSIGFTIANVPRHFRGRFTLALQNALRHVGVKRDR